MGSFLWAKVTHTFRVAHLLFFQVHRDNWLKAALFQTNSNADFIFITHKRYKIWSRNSSNLSETGHCLLIRETKQHCYEIINHTHFQRRCHSDTTVSLWFMCFWGHWYLRAQILMGVIKPGSKVMSALYNHSWCYSPEGCFDVLQTFGESLWDQCCDWQGRQKKYVQYITTSRRHCNPVSRHLHCKFPRTLFTLLLNQTWLMGRWAIE